MIATVAIGIVLHQGARILAPFAMAIFVWLVMEGFARAIRRPFPDLPGWLAYLFAVIIVVLSIVIFIGVIRGAVEEFVGKSSDYERHINDIIKQVYTQLEPACRAGRTSTSRASASRARAMRATLAGARAPCRNVRRQPPTVAQLLSSNATSIAQIAGNVASSLVGDMAARLHLCRLPDRVGQRLLQSARPDLQAPE